MSGSSGSGGSRIAANRGGDSGAGFTAPASAPAMAATRLVTPIAAAAPAMREPREGRLAAACIRPDYAKRRAMQSAAHDHAIRPIPRSARANTD
ncbi:MAG TPA: hypothetical protein VGO52_07060 [Hyphomonadaceae bacterium]|nr:hypothetical protein [Hyphomonadaceae bacterium]